jgi:hemerythrin-like metal-binding protein
MPWMTWSEKLSVGVGVLDEDHKRLVGMINELHDARQTRHGRETLGRILGELVEYSKVHFDREETFFAQTGYPAADSHKRQHEALTRQVLDLQQRYQAGTDVTISAEVMTFLKKWLVTHILASDQGYRIHLNAMGIH